MSCKVTNTPYSKCNNINNNSVKIYLARYHLMISRLLDVLVYTQKK